MIKLNLDSLLLKDFLNIYPNAAAWFNERRMLCVGCPVAPHVTVANTLAIYHIDPETFQTEIQRFIQTKENHQNEQ